MSDVDPRIEEIPEERRAATPGGKCVHAIKVDLPAMSVLARRVKLMCGKITTPSAPDQQSRICENCYTQMLRAPNDEAGQ